MACLTSLLSELDFVMMDEVSMWVFLTFFLSLCILRESETAQVGEGQRERERIASRLCTVSTEPHAGLELTNHEIMT